MMPRIALKYCGGCNCRYDRAVILKRVKEDFGDVEFITMPEDGEYDAVVVITGCASQCATHQGLIGRAGKVITDCEEDYEKVAALLERAGLKRITHG
jgi:hypothetical protein